MDARLYKSGAVETPPEPPASPSLGYPTSGDNSSGLAASVPGPYRDYMIGQSLQNIIQAAGLTPDHTDLTLLRQAILKLVSATNHVVRLEDVTFGPSVADGDAVYWDSANSRYDQAIADGTDKQKMVGFADVTNSLVEAFGRSALFSGLTAGSKYYLSGSTAGAITTTAPSEKVSVGHAKSATVMFVDIDPVAGTPIQDQTTWNTGTDTTESIISPDKLDKKIKTLSLGDGQTPQDVTGSRSKSVNYTNTTGRTIEIIVTVSTSSSGQTVVVTVDGVALNNANFNSFDRVVYATVPDGAVYSVSGTFNAIKKWVELR